MKVFPSLLDSVRSYANNLNKTRYYFGFRRMRAHFRRSGKPLSGSALASAMTRYSTQKDAYILNVKRIIRDNRLFEFEGARLEEEAQ
jgi:Bax protein